MGSRLTASGTDKVNWEEFIRRASEYLDSGKLETQEIKYKVEIGRKLATAKTAVLNQSDGWGDLVKSGIAGNLIFPINQAKFRDWIDASPEDALIALRAIWAHDLPSVYDRIGAYYDLNPHPEIGGPGTRMNVASVLLMGLDAEHCVPFMKTVFENAYDSTGYVRPDSRADEVALYEHALDFLDRFIEEASERGLKLRHRLDAQSVVWVLRERKKPTPPPPPPPDMWSPGQSGGVGKKEASLAARLFAKDHRRP